MLTHPWTGQNMIVYSDSFSIVGVEGGTLTKFVEMIRNMDETHHQLQSSLLWKQAWDECMKTNEVEAVVRNLNDGAFEGTRSLILSLTNGA